MSEHDQKELTHEERIAQIAGMIKDIKFAMLTVSTDEGHLHSHPMTTQQTEFDGDVWFIGSKKSEQVACMRARPQVNVSYSNPGKGLYVSINGTAALVEDSAKLDELWSDFYEAYFPQGKTDPDIQLIRVNANGAEFWESDGKLHTLFAFARQKLTGKGGDDLGTNETVRL